ncbi:THUMP-like domain-containing protein [Allomuricauda sp. SCSIO 65647]|uniref:class I SAM-dependent methyltransferase n=1 Tax=Allomuricauda sp. SCSIO 65647 TaxID=2908843 RepID=UPI0028BE93CE|nr:class I SAM-dependent methyltransferase [Muricauda sp. SCSIO 65647]
MSVLLKKPLFDGISQKELAQQLEGKKKSKDKLPTWFKTAGIYYPKKLHLEQTSSEATAAYKAGLIGAKTLVDITGGFGVDSYFFAKQVTSITHCEINTELAEIVAHNFEVLGVENISFHNQDGIEFLKGLEDKVEWVFADPSRRDDKNGRVFILKDCVPDVVGHLETIFGKTENVMLKTSPLLDISQGIKELSFVAEVHVVAVKNEVKELLWILRKGQTDEPRITTVNLVGHAIGHFSFLPSEEKSATIDFALPNNYLYEPNAAILKAGAFKNVGIRFNLKKLHEHSHLYTSDVLIDFPGRRFAVESVIPYGKKSIRQLGLGKANITVRNFPESVATIRKKHNIREGGDTYLFFTTDLEGKLIVIKCLKENPKSSFL